MENKELHENFLKDFKELLKKYDAEFNLDWCSYDREDKPMIMFNSQYPNREYSELRLPRYIDGDEN